MDRNILVMFAHWLAAGFEIARGEGSALIFLNPTCWLSAKNLCPTGTVRLDEPHQQ
jgi:hypothetical protein